MALAVILTSGTDAGTAVADLAAVALVSQADAVGTGLRRGILVDGWPC